MSGFDAGKPPPRDRAVPVVDGQTGCEACQGRGYIVGEDLGLVGMVSDDGVALPIPCICCEQTSAGAAPQQPPPLPCKSDIAED
jgi:hypothetical protein